MGETGYLGHLDKPSSGRRHPHKYRNEVQMPWIWVCQKNMSNNTLSIKGSCPQYSVTGAKASTWLQAKNVEAFTACFHPEEK